MSLEKQGLQLCPQDIAYTGSQTMTGGAEPLHMANVAGFSSTSILHIGDADAS